MNTDPRSISISRKRATRARSRIVFFLLRRALRRMAVSVASAAGGGGPTRVAEIAAYPRPATVHP